MEDGKMVQALLGLPGDVLDQITALLAKVGIDLAPLWLQLFLLVLVGALFVVARKRLRARDKSRRVPLIAVVALGLVMVGILIGLVDNATTPSRVAGTLRSDRPSEIRLALLDFRDRSMSAGSGLVDTASGHFALHYNPIVEGRARKLRITATRCRAQDIELSRAQLRAEVETQWSYECVAPG